MQNKLILVYLILALCISTLKCYEYSNHPYTTYYPEDPNQVFPREDTSCAVGKYPGLFWDGQKCDSCWSKQCYCKAYQGCDSCTDYYSKDNNGKCKACGYIVLPPQSEQPLTCCFDSKCNYPYSAVTCEAGAYKFGGVCVKLKYCATYSQFATCTKCQAGYYLDDDQTCQECEREHCIECYGPYLCKTCQEGYYLSVKQYTNSNDADSYRFGTCEECSSLNCTCKVDNTIPVCTGCISNGVGLYWNSAQKTCDYCGDSCKTCQNSTACKTCVDKYYLDSLTGSCSLCTGNCFNCTYSNGAQKCVSTTCFNGYYYNYETSLCVECTQTNAARCKGLNDINITQCVTGLTNQVEESAYFSPYWFTHNQEYYLVEYTEYYANGTVKGKTRECITNPGDCKQVQKGYDASITDYETNCLSCYTELGYVLLKKDSLCYQCDDSAVGKDGCIKCHSGDTSLVGFICDTCLSGVDIDDLYYVRQWWWMDSESTFDSFTNTRASSIINYYLDKSDTTSLDAVTCTECSDGCKTCTNNLACTACQKGYRLTTDKTCEQCDDTQCSDCKVSKDQCVTCFAGYRRYSDDSIYKCQPCSQYCLKCESNQDVCTQCYSGEDNTFDTYLSNNGQCLKKRNHCVMGSATGDCALCEYGFRIVNGWCHQCGSVSYDGSEALAYVNCYDYCLSKDFISDGGSSSSSSSSTTNTNSTNNLNIGSPILSYTYAILILISMFILILA